MEESYNRLPRAWSVDNILEKRYDLLELEGPWLEAFGRPARGSLWFVWGNSGSGKGAFMMELAKELARLGKVAVNDLEEGAGHTVQRAFLRHGMAEVKRRLIWCCEDMEVFGERLARPRGPEFAIVNSYQYTDMSFRKFREWRARGSGKTVVVVSQADGKKPLGRAAVSVMYDADQKIHVEGYRAYSKGRYIGPNGGVYTIWEEGAANYHGDSKTEQL